VDKIETAALQCRQL